MDETAYYGPVGDWLLAEQGCQSEPYFQGYAIDTPITHKRKDTRRRPDVIGVRYEQAETKTVSYSFHFHAVEVKAGTDSQQVQNLMGELESLRQFTAAAVLAADTITYWAAVPTLDPPTELREWAKENDIGLLAIETADDAVATVRELIAPVAVDRGIKRSEFVSNTDQRSPGNFRRAIESTSILQKLMDPEAFYEANIRPEQ